MTRHDLPSHVAIVLDGNGEVVERWKGATDRAEIEAALALVSNQG